MAELIPITYWHWLIFGLMLLILEVLSFTAILLWAGVGAFITALLAYLLPDTSWQMQALCFALSTLLLLVLTRAWIRRKDITTEQPTLNRRADGLIGQVHLLAEPIVGGRGKINIHDTIWQLQGPELPAGSSVSVVAVDGNTLRVELCSRP